HGLRQRQADPVHDGGALLVALPHQRPERASQSLEQFGAPPGGLIWKRVCVLKFARVHFDSLPSYLESRPRYLSATRRHPVCKSGHRKTAPDTLVLFCLQYPCRVLTPGSESDILCITKYS